MIHTAATGTGTLRPFYMSVCVCFEINFYFSISTRRFWTPIGCEYDDVTPVEARKCMGNRTLAFIGDSQIRDLAVGVAFLLLGIDMGGYNPIVFLMPLF